MTETAAWTQTQLFLVGDEGPAEVSNKSVLLSSFPWQDSTAPEAGCG